MWVGEVLVVTGRADSGDPRPRVRRGRAAGGAPGPDQIEMAHEALLWAWPRLRAWITTDRAGLRVLVCGVTDPAAVEPMAGRAGPNPAHSGQAPGRRPHTVSGAGQLVEGVGRPLSGGGETSAAVERGRIAARGAPRLGIGRELPMPESP
ncbi:hypothetical protein AB0L00_12170 [Actinoallomurus sp. NPDC052308]|uniref:nSTAND1 domain-containing NTPase n=1 Tax=Actinoallomurus sp. NPDC052308 TaxID=3155530 RepID=UPI00342F41AE